MQILDHMSGQVIWNWVDERVEPDDMFVSLEVVNGHLIWCTNHGYYGFIALAGSRADARVSGSLVPVTIEGLADLVSSSLYNVC